MKRRVHHIVVDPAVVRRRSERAVRIRIRQQSRRRRLLLILLQTTLAWLVLCGIAYMQSHGATDITSRHAQDTATRLPTGQPRGYVGEAAARLAEQRQMAQTDHHRINAIQSGQLTGADHRWNQIAQWSWRVTAWVGAPLLFLSFVARSRGWRIPGLPRARPRPRSWLWLAVTVLVLGFAGGATSLAVNSANLAYNTASAVAACRDIKFLTFCSPDHLAHTLENRAELDPIGSAIYGQRVPEEVNRQFLRDVIAGRPGDPAVVRQHYEAAQQVTEGRRQLVSYFAWGYTASRNGPSLLLADIAQGFWHLRWLLLCLFVPAVWAAAMWERLTLRMYLFLLPGALAALFAGGLAVTLYSWIAIQLPAVLAVTGPLGYGLSFLVVTAMGLAVTWLLVIKLVPLLYKYTATHRQDIMAYLEDFVTRKR